MRIRAIELRSYGETADFEAIGFGANELDLDYIPDGRVPKGGSDVS